MLYVGKKTPRINNWRDGMLIDVGRISANHCYCITVVSSNDEVGWNSPLAEIAVSDKKDLIEKIQGTILKFRL